MLWDQAEKSLTNNKEEYRLTCSFIHSLVFLSLREQISLRIVIGLDKQTTNSKLNLIPDFCIPGR